MKRVIAIIFILLMTMVIASCSSPSEAINPTDSAGRAATDEQISEQTSADGQTVAPNLPELQSPPDANQAIKNLPPASTQTENSVNPEQGGNLASPAPEEKAESVSLTIKKQEGSYVLNKAPISIQTGDSVLSVLIRAGKEQGFPVVFSGSKKTAYIQGIDNLFEFDLGPESGWIYGVNGVKSMQSSGAYPVSANDEIIWVYVTSLKEDIK